MNSQTIVTATANHVATEMQGETVILSFTTGEYYGLDEVGALIWKHIQQPTTIAQLCEIIMTEYEVDEAQCMQDVQALVTDLVAHELATVQTLESSL